MAPIPYFDGFTTTANTDQDHLVVWYGDGWECVCGRTFDVDWHARFHSFFPRDAIPRKNPYRPS